MTDASAGGRIVKEALTFDDVLLIPGHSLVHPKDTDVSTIVTRGIELRIPLLAAAMDTVTESAMAIQMAREGGLGIIHKNLPAEKQAEEVDRVKRSESGMILNPITLRRGGSLQDAHELMARFSISGVPIVEDDGRLVGIITNRDLQFETDLSKSISEVMTSENLVTVPVGTTLDQAQEILHQHRIEKLPVVDESGELKGLITVKDIFKRRRYPDACKDEHGRLRTGAAIGASAADLERAQLLVEAGADVLVVDTAHGHSEGVLKAVATVRERFPDVQLIGGNVGTVEGAKALVDRGVDAVKVGVGPGSICTTRVVTGVGLPQLSAIMDAVAGADGSVPIIADGGIRYSGDLVKALAAGAHSVMMGSMFAGTDESPGETFLLEGRRFKTVRGMGSLSAMEEGSADRYFQDSSDQKRKLVPEGIEARVPYKGPVSDTIYQLIGGLRAGMGYCGVGSIDELRTETRFNRITMGGLRESHPHDVTITREAPNYHG
ncbi:MAG: IMP dehydrogenase [Gemmatimonadota bacterium]|nr:IMP dehydrogenase [Gemmatimonadota bacterium]MDE3004800.1 IMP dehydrogenase [Gemmatimonadota bacterium]MDE3014469.1 IMP dehydrogenase [Gemmatimonadota bacterium]